MKPGISRLRAGTDGFVEVEGVGSEHSAKSEQKTTASCSTIDLRWCMGVIVGSCENKTNSISQRLHTT